MLAPAAFTSCAMPTVSSFFSTAQGPAIVPHDHSMPQQRVEQRLAVLSGIEVQEVRFARNDGEPQGAQSLHEKVPAFDIPPPAFLYVLLIFQGSKRRFLGGAVGIEG